MSGTRADVWPRSCHPHTHKHDSDAEGNSAYFYAVRITFDGILEVYYNGYCSSLENWKVVLIIYYNLQALSF